MTPAKIKSPMKPKVMPRNIINAALEARFSHKNNARNTKTSDVLNF